MPLLTDLSLEFGTGWFCLSEAFGVLQPVHAGLDRALLRVILCKQHRKGNVLRRGTLWAIAHDVVSPAERLLETWYRRVGVCFAEPKEPAVGLEGVAVEHEETRQPDPCFCIVCLDDAVEPVMPYVCDRHAFCRDTCAIWNSCPVCRADAKKPLRARTAQGRFASVTVVGFDECDSD